MRRALDYYEQRHRFSMDSGRDDGGIAQLSLGDCRIFLTTDQVRDHFRTAPPVVIWINLASIADVDALHRLWVEQRAEILHPPESKPWSRLHELVITDPDGNFIRVFHGF